MSKRETLKSIALATMIVVGFMAQSKTAHAENLQTLTVAGGCFWCVEADFEKVRGVKEAVSGFTGGTVPNPSYKQVTSGGTGHYEAVQITFDADVVSRRTLLDLFFRSIDPTDAGGQFCDRGEGYRSAIFTSTAAEEKIATAAKTKAAADLGLSDPAYAQTVMRGLNLSVLLAVPLFILAAGCLVASGLAGQLVELAQHVTRHRSEEHTSELQSRPHISYAVFCLKKKKKR